MFDFEGLTLNRQVTITKGTCKCSHKKGVLNNWEIGKYSGAAGPPETPPYHHTRPMAQTLFGHGMSPAILVLDGTYIYIQKSSQFRFQRRSFAYTNTDP